MKTKSRETSRELESVKNGWTEQERAERRLLAAQKQLWLYEMIGIDVVSQEVEEIDVPLASAG